MTVEEFLMENNIEISEDKKNLLIPQGCPVLVNGKTGSGKTLLLLTRIAYLIEGNMVHSKHMLNLCFDRDTAKEMTKHYRYYYGESEDTPIFTDIHNFAYQIIRMYNKERDIDTWKAYKDTGNVIRRLVKEMFALDLRHQEVYHIVKKISYCRNMMLPERDIQKIEVVGIDFFALYKAYEKFKAKRSIYDYDDILVTAVNMLMKDAKLLEKVQQRYAFIHVDDAQELSFLSHMLIKMVVSSTCELFLCADKDISIAFEHAAYKEALDTFTQSYPNAKLYELNGNYRCNKTIVETANAFFYKDLEGMQAIRNDITEIKYKGFADITKLYEYAVKKVVDDENETVFVYRNFAMAVPLIDRFIKENISFAFQGNLEHFIQESFVKDMWNFIELLVDARDLKAFYEVYEKLGLDISKKVLLEVGERIQTDESVDVYQALMESSYKAAGKKKLASIIERIRMAENKNTLDMIMFILEKLGYRALLLKANIKLQEPVIVSLMTIAQHYPNPDEFLHVISNLKTYKSEPNGRVQIKSAEHMRGKDYERVIVLDCIGGMFPRHQSEDEEIQRERTLFFMSMTKAKNMLEFLSTKRSHLTRLDISPYLYELHTAVKEEQEVTPTISLPKVNTSKKLRITSIRRGVRLKHVQLGEGTVMKVVDGMMHVKFESGVKQMNIKLCLANNLIELA